MFDRILLLLLVILLPLGIVMSRMFTGELSFGTNQSSSVDEKKVEEIVKRLNPSQSSASPSVGKEFNVTGMVYATESGKLKVVGMSPNDQTLLWIWTASSQTKSRKAITSASASASAEARPIWDGPLVIQPQAGGFFSVEVDVSLMAGIVEIRLEQGTSRSVVRYDLEKRAQIVK